MDYDAHQALLARSLHRVHITDDDDDQSQVCSAEHLLTLFRGIVVAVLCALALAGLYFNPIG